MAITRQRCSHLHPCHKDLLLKMTPHSNAPVNNTFRTLDCKARVFWSVTYGRQPPLGWSLDILHSSQLHDKGKRPHQTGSSSCQHLIRSSLPDVEVIKKNIMCPKTVRSTCRWRSMSQRQLQRFRSNQNFGST